MNLLYELNPRVLCAFGNVYTYIGLLSFFEAIELKDQKNRVTASELFYSTGHMYKVDILFLIIITLSQELGLPLSCTVQPQGPEKMEDLRNARISHSFQ